VAFRRVLNTPPRGIGTTSAQVLEDVARTRGMPLADAAGRVLDEQLLGGRAAASLRGFLDLIDELARRADADEVAGLVETVVEQVGYAAYLRKVYPGQDTERMENVRALVSATVEYIEEDEQSTLRGFLDRLALVSDADEVGARPGVTLMTIHCAKGLEYPVVFLAGLEENLFPHAMSIRDPHDLEEERRLCYVAMTRAKERLLLSYAAYRRTEGVLMVARPSRFLEEIPATLLRQSSERLQDHLAEALESGIEEPRSGSTAVRVAAAIRAREAARVAPRMPAAPGPDPGDGFPVGAYVSHPSFGAGRIVERAGRGKSLKLTIHFADHGPKRIAPAYTKLRVQVD